MLKPIGFSELLDRLTNGEYTKEELAKIRPLIHDYMNMVMSTTGEIKFSLDTYQLYYDVRSDNPYMDEWMASTMSCSGIDANYNYNNWSNRRPDPDWDGEFEFFSYDE